MIPRLDPDGEKLPRLYHVLLYNTSGYVYTMRVAKYLRKEIILGNGERRIEIDWAQRFLEMRIYICSHR